MLRILVHLHTALLAAPSGARRERGQSTAEYALVLLGAAAVALLVLSWATNTNMVSRLMNAVMTSITSRVGGG